jgi:hypothetical protein
MLIPLIIIGWIVTAVALAVYAMRTAEEPPLVECFDCNRDACTNCPYLERARCESEDLYIEERKLAA